MAELIGCYSLEASGLSTCVQESLIYHGNELVLSRFTDDFYANLELRYPYKRSIARDGLLVLHCLQQAIDKLVLPPKTGIYSAALNGPLLYNAINECKQESNIEEVKCLKKKYPPKQHFRQNAPLRATHYSMVLKKYGPMVSMVDPINGFIDALNWAEIDLCDGTVDCAVVVSGFSFEDPQILDWYSKSSGHLKESAVCLVLKTDSNLCQHPKLSRDIHLDYGQCTGFFHSNLNFSKEKNYV